MLIFAMIIVLWAVIGFVGVLNCKAERVNFELLFFFGFVPFIPMFAKIFEII